MRRCTHCFRFHPGAPTFCSRCGRSFDVRICSRGHRNPRGVQFCSECGSADLSTPAPPASFLHHLSGVVLYLFSGLTIALIVLVAVLAVLYSINWKALAPSLIELVLMVGFLYWTTTLLPGPIRKLGKAAGRWVWKSGKTGNTSRNGKH
jgi:hypothetical protein